jgi:hypothetical protein
VWSISLLFKKKECVPYSTSWVPFGRFVAHRCSRPLLHGPGPILSDTRSSLPRSEFILFSVPQDQKPFFLVAAATGTVPTGQR